MRKYKAWIQYEQHLQAVFEAADTDKSGTLDPAQLHVFLQGLASEKGLAEPVNDQDVKFILERCDKSKEGDEPKASAVHA